MYLVFNVANIIQSILFALLHGVMFFPLVGVEKSLLIITFTGLVAYFLGFINEVKFKGSIIPSWIIHALSNIFAGLSSAFLFF